MASVFLDELSIRNHRREGVNETDRRREEKNVFNRNKHGKFIRKRSRRNICSISHHCGADAPPVAHRHEKMRIPRDADHKHRPLLTIILINSLRGSHPE